MSVMTMGCSRIMTLGSQLLSELIVTHNPRTQKWQPEDANSHPHSKNLLGESHRFYHCRSSTPVMQE